MFTRIESLLKSLIASFLPKPKPKVNPKTEKLNAAVKKVHEDKLIYSLLPKPVYKPKVVIVIEPKNKMEEIELLFDKNDVGYFYCPQSAKNLNVNDKVYYSTLTGYVYNTEGKNKVEIGTIKKVNKDIMGNVMCKVKKKKDFNE